jgi:hypothetical protein
MVLVHKDERYKTIFTTPWGAFIYENMSFGLMNVGETFQGYMDIDFIYENDRFIFIYLYDMTIYSNSNDEHLKHLMQVFIKCR